MGKNYKNKEKGKKKNSGQLLAGFERKNLDMVMLP